MEKTLPININAEQGVLGSILIDPDGIAHVADFLRPDDFYRDAHKTIFETMLTLYQHRRTPDMLTVCDELARVEKIHMVGGASYIASLVNSVPTSTNIEDYGHIVEREALNRHVILAAGQIATLGYERADDIMPLVMNIVYSIERHKSRSQFTSLSEVMNRYLVELDAVHQKRGSLIGIPTGFTDIDAMLGGLQKTDLIVLAARPSMGKSALALSMAYNAAKKGHTVAIFSLEMGANQLALRLMAMQSHIDMQRLRNGWIESTKEWESILDAYAYLTDLGIWINDTAGNPITAMRSQLHKLSLDHKPDLVIVDYLQLVGSEVGTKRENRVYEIGEMTKGLKSIAREFDLPILCLAQLSRAPETRASKIPQLSDLRESGNIENDADIVSFIYRDDYYAEKEGRDSVSPNVADILIAKHRNGPTGTVKLFFKADETRFYDLEEGR